jgi:hypothetical protein
MMIPQVDTISVRELAAQVGEAIYEQKLKPVLEPAYHGQVVAIHLPSQDYFLGHSLLEATDLLRQKYSNAGRGEVYARGVGERAVICAHTPRVTKIQQ